MKKYLDKYYDKARIMELQQKEFDQLIAVFKKLGIKTKDKVLVDESLSFTRPLITENVKLFPENLEAFPPEFWNASSFYRSCVCNRKSQFFIDITKKSRPLGEVAKAIRDAGGVVVLAHTWIYNFDDHMKKVKQLYDAGHLDGIECHYYTFSKEQTDKLLAFCKQNNLIITGGSDYHGTFRDTKIAYGKDDNVKAYASLLKQFPESFYYKK